MSGPSFVGMMYCSRMLLRSQYFGLCVTPEAFQRELKRLKLPRIEWPSFMKSATANATCHHLYNVDKRRVSIVCLGDFKECTPVEVAGLLIHEAVHIFDEEMSVIGECEPGDEIRAYGIQHISQELMQAFVDLTARKR